MANMMVITVGIVTLIAFALIVVQRMMKSPGPPPSGSDNSENVVVVTRKGRPVANLVPFSPDKKADTPEDDERNPKE